ncbi:MAG: DUF1573 domain-containing protein [Candidatus Kapaibacteriota bacterium]
MKKVLIFVIFLAFAGIAYAEPKIEIVGGDTYDWGKVNSTMGFLKKEIFITNVGNEDLVIYSVNPNCGCTTAPISKNTLKPGDTASLNVTVNISTYSGDIKKGVEIKSNDPNNPGKYLWLKAYVVKPITLFPQYLNFANMMINKETLTKVVITNSTDQPITIKSISIYPDSLKINIKEGDKIPANGEFVLEAKYTPKSTGRFMANLKLLTDNKDVPEIILNGFGNIAEPLNDNK